MSVARHHRRGQKNRTLCHCVKENCMTAIYLILFLNSLPLTNQGTSSDANNIHGHS